MAPLSVATVVKAMSPNVVSRAAATPASAETIVIGTGVVGMATAWSLARRGVAVTLVDAAMGPGEGASFANGGQLSYGYTDALASPDLPLACAP